MDQKQQQYQQATNYPQGSTRGTGRGGRGGYSGYQNQYKEDGYRKQHYDKSGGNYIKNTDNDGQTSNYKAGGHYKQQQYDGEHSSSYRGRGGRGGYQGRGGHDNYHQRDRNDEKTVQNTQVNTTAPQQETKLIKTSKGLFSADFDMMFGPKATTNKTEETKETTQQNDTQQTQNISQDSGSKPIKIQDNQQNDSQQATEVQKTVQENQPQDGQKQNIQQQDHSTNKQANNDYQKSSSQLQEQSHQYKSQQINGKSNQHQQQNNQHHDKNRNDHHYNDRSKQYDGRFKNYQEKRDFQKKHQKLEDQKEEAKTQQQNGPNDNTLQDQTPVAKNEQQEEKKVEKVDFVPDPNFQWSLDLEGIMTKGKKKKRDVDTSVPFVIQSGTSKQRNELKENIKMKLAENLEFSTIHIDKMNKGFTNTSNCCYMNVVLQSLLSIPAFYNMLVAISENQEVMKELGPDSLLRKFVYLSQYFNPTQQLDKKSPFAASPVDAEKIFAELNQNFNPYQEHQDCHEFLALLLDLLHDELKLIYVPSEDEKNIKGVVDEWQEVGNKNAKCQFNNNQQHIQQSLIRDIFGGIVRNEFQVDRSSKVSVTYEPFFFLNLEVNRSETLEECLNAFFKAKPLNDYKIDGKEVKATHQQQIDKLPNILILQLKRFIYRDGPVKVGDYIEFPEVLRIQDNCLSTHLRLNTFNKQERDEMGRSYRLTSVVIHKGTQLSRGHYICYVLDASNNWIQYDDNKIKKMIDVEVVFDSQAFLLFYELII